MRRWSMPRVLAAVTGLALLAPVVWATGVVIFLTLLAAQPPDPFQPDGDPCCPRPDSWGATAGWIGFVLLAAFAVGVVACAAVTLLAWAVRGRPARGKRLALVPAGAVGVTALLSAALLIASAGDARTWPDCDEVTVTPDSLSYGDTYEAKRLVDHCGLVDGASRAEVRSRLGPPGATASGGRRWYYDGDLAITFEYDRVVRAEHAE